MALPLAVVALYPSSCGSRPASRPSRISDGDEGIGAAATLLPRATYVWDFFNARKGGEVKSFIITCPRDGKDYLVVFEDTELTLETFNVRLYSTGLTLVQVDEPDMPTNEDGSLDLEE